MNRYNHSFIMESKLHDVKGRVDYISNPERQENLYAVFSNVEDDYWKLLAEQNQRDFLKSGTKGTCIEARELIIMLPPSLINMDHKLLLEYITSVFTDKYNVGCCAALHHNKRKTNLHIHLIFSEREMKQKADQKIASRNMFYNEEGKHVRTKKEILDEDGKVRAGCRIIKKGEVYERNYFGPKLTEFKTNEFLVNMKQSMTDRMNLFVKDENERLHVFQKGGPYLATKKIGKNNPKEMEMRVDNYLRQEWNRHVDRALLVDVPAEYLIEAKREQIDQIVEKSILEHGQAPKLFTEIVQKAIGWLRGLIEYMRETEHCEIDKNGNMVLDHNLTIDLTPEPVPEHVKGKRPSSVEQEAKVLELQQILNKLKKQERKIYAMEKNIVQQEKCLEEVKRKLFHRKEQKELENKIELKKGQLESAKDTLAIIPKQYGYKSILEISNELKHAKKELADVRQKQEDWDATEHEKVYEVVAANVQGITKHEQDKRLMTKKKSKNTLLRGG